MLLLDLYAGELCKECISAPYQFFTRVGRGIAGMTSWKMHEHDFVVFVTMQLMEAILTAGAFLAIMQPMSILLTIVIGILILHYL